VAASVPSPLIATAYTFASLLSLRPSIGRSRAARASRSQMKTWLKLLRLNSVTARRPSRLTATDSNPLSATGSAVAKNASMCGCASRAAASALSVSGVACSRVAATARGKARS
jgi:hypothetical protein